MAELTDDDVRAMKQFLADTHADVKRWLPEPEWCPGWQSEAAAERGNDERGPDGPWGPNVVRSVYVAALFLEAVLQCMRAMAQSITIDPRTTFPTAWPVQRWRLGLRLSGSWSLALVPAGG